MGMTVFLQFQNMIVFHMGIWQVHATLKELVQRAVKETHVCFLLSWSVELFFQHLHGFIICLYGLHLW